MHPERNIKKINKNIRKMKSLGIIPNFTGEVKRIRRS